MNRFGKVFRTLLGVMPIMAIGLLSACAPAAASTVCHATGDATNPYEKISVTAAELAVHEGHPNDLIPAPMGGCPTSPVVINNGQITICHATGNQGAPFDEVTVNVNGLNGHGDDQGDIFPAPEGGCPTTAASPTRTAGATGGKITICHETGSKTNPYVEITIGVNGLNGHDKHSGDIIPAPAGGCPTSKP